MATTKLAVKELAGRMPEVDKPGTASKFTGPNPAEAEAIYKQILAGGADSVRELAELTRDPADPEFQDYKAEYTLHGLVVYAGAPGRDKERRLTAEVLAALLDNARISKATRGLYIRELQWIGGPESVPALGRQLADEELGPYAVAALVAIGPPALPALRQGLTKTTGRNQIAVIQALGRLGDPSAADDLKNLALGADDAARPAALWALANIGDRTAVDLLLQAADKAANLERVQNTKACLLLAEKLASANRPVEAKRIYEHLRKTRTDAKERYAREAAEKALAALNQML